MAEHEHDEQCEREESDDTCRCQRRAYVAATEAPETEEGDADEA